MKRPWNLGPEPGLLVSVRSSAEALEAVLGGASVLDVKEPARGPLGCADPSIWRDVRRVVPVDRPVSVALGELRDWIDRPAIPSEAFEGIAFRKLGLSGLADRDWVGEWAQLRDRMGAGPPWIAVAYLDSDRAGAPEPTLIREVARTLPDCAGLLLDTWDKRRPADGPPMDGDWFEPLRQSGLLIALAGGLDAEAIRALAPLRPDLFGVRGAACASGDRHGRVDRDRVRTLVEAIRQAAAVEEPQIG